MMRIMATRMKAAAILAERSMSVPSRGGFRPLITAVTVDAVEKGNKRRV
jgi:hypothetical protein